MCNVSIGGIELIFRVEAVALFRYRERDDARIARSETRKRCVGVGRADQQLTDRTDDARARCGT